MSFYTLLLAVLPYMQLSDCQLTKSFEAPFIKVKYTENWNYFRVGETYTLMYYEESNFERREEAEISFMYYPAPNKSFLKDTATLATRYVSATMAQLKGIISKKYPGSEVNLTIDEETRVRMANTQWSKVVVNYSGTDEEGETKKGYNCFYFNFTEEGTIMIRTNHYYPEIKTVNAEMPCILKAIEVIS